MLYRDSSEDFIARVKNIEHCADQCLDHFALLTTPRHVARWTILSATIHMIEENYGRFGPDSAAFRAATINLSRHAPMLIRWLGESGTASLPSDWIPQWESFVGAQAFSDLRVVANYDAFLSTFPMWYRNRMSAELLSADVVRFLAVRDPRDRQVSAFQKGLPTRSGMHRAVPGKRLEPTEAILRRYERILDAAHPEGARGFRYEHPEELASRTMRKYPRQG